MKKTGLFALIALFGILTLQSCNKGVSSVGVSESEDITFKHLLQSNENNVQLLECTAHNFLAEKRGEIELKEYKNGNEVLDFTFERAWISTVQLTDFSHVTFEDTPRDLDEQIERVELVMEDGEGKGVERVIFETNVLGTTGPVNPGNIADFIDLYPSFKIYYKIYYKDAFDGPRSLLTKVSIGYSYDYNVKPLKD